MSKKEPQRLASRKRRKGFKPGIGRCSCLRTTGGSWRPSSRRRSRNSVRRRKKPSAGMSGLRSTRPKKKREEEEKRKRVEEDYRKNQEFLAEWRAQTKRKRRVVKLMGDPPPRRAAGCRTDLGRQSQPGKPGMARRHESRGA